jgi:hypothetical protein
MGSENTLRAAIADLIAHGFIYRTKSRGPNKQWARYAVTWKPIKNKEGLYLQGFMHDAWKDWEPTKKKHPQKSDGSDHQKVMEPLLLSSNL